MNRLFALVLSLSAPIAVAAPRGPVYKVISVTPTVSASPDYQANDQVGGVQTLTDAAIAGRATKLISLSVLDKAAQGAALQIVFCTALPTLASGDNEAFDLTDANMAKCKGHVAIGTGDYQASASNTLASVKGINLILESGNAGIIYAVAKTTGTPNLGATDDLVFTYAFEQGE